MHKTIKTVTDPKLKFELRYQLASAHFKKKDYENSAKIFDALIPEAAKSQLLPSILFQAGESRLALPKPFRPVNTTWRRTKQRTCRSHWPSRSC